MNVQSTDIINNLEQEYGIYLDTDYDAGVDGLCRDTHCHEECSCVDNFKSFVTGELQKEAIAILERERKDKVIVAEVDSVWGRWVVNFDGYDGAPDSPNRYELGYGPTRETAIDAFLERVN